MSRSDRMVGAMLGMAAGDALGAPYEFGPPLDDDVPVELRGGGSLNWEPGEWTDDTSMAIPIARAAAEGLDLRAESTLDRIVGEWLDWTWTAPDVGVQTGTVLRAAKGASAARAREQSRALHEKTGRSAGNGSLMRTAPVALAFLGDRDGLVDAARTISELTHFDVDAGDACVIWCLAIRHAVLTGDLDLRGQLDALPSDRAARWARLLDEAEAKHPRDFPKNGWVVQALQGAWSAITHGHGLVDTLERAVRGGKDADTVAAIAGSLAGAVHGASAVPAQWRRVLHGWPGIGASELTGIAYLAGRGGEPDELGWPDAEHLDYSPWGDLTTLVPHPHDDGVLLGAVGSLAFAGTDAVVSLCRTGTTDARVAPGDHVEQWLVDRPDPDENQNLDLVLADSADAVAAFRAEGKTVLLHCVQAVSRTPSVGALYAARHLGIPIDEAIRDVAAALPAARPNPFLVDAIRRVAAR